jgi:hypothetical protein
VVHPGAESDRNDLVGGYTEGVGDSGFSSSVGDPLVSLGESCIEVPEHGVGRLEDGEHTASASTVIPLFPHLVERGSSEGDVSSVPTSRLPDCFTCG